MGRIFTIIKGTYIRAGVWLSVVGLALLSFCVHFLPFLLYGPHPLGYDTGFYRRYLLQPLISFPNTPVPGLGNDALLPRLVLDLLRLAHIPTDILLYGSYLFFFALIPILLVFCLRTRLGLRGASIAGFFFIVSAVSYNAYWYMLLKNALALDLILLAFFLIENQQYTLLYFVDIAIAISHETSTIVYILTLGIFFILQKTWRRQLLLHTAFTLSIFLAVNLSFIHQASIVLPSALFLEWPQYVIFSLPFLGLCLIGMRAFYSMHIPRIFLAFGIASFIFPVLHLPFYERIFVFCDLALVTYAAYAAEYLLVRVESTGFSKRMYLPIAALCVALGLLLGNLYNQVQLLRPLISSEDVTAIANLNANVPQGAYLLTTADEAPWYEGWTQAHIIAPGLLHDTHNLEAWQAFWSATSTASQTAFLHSFPNPLYISTLGPPENLLGNIGVSCLKQIATYLYFYHCDTSPITNATSTHNTFSTTAQAVGVYELHGNTIWTWNVGKKWPIASLTKIMTALIADTLFSPNQQIEITQAAEQPLIDNQATPTFAVGDNLTEHDLIASMFLVSSNDAAESLANKYGYSNFIHLMNAEATKLGMTHTIFFSASGLSPKNVSTVADLVKLVRFTWANDPDMFKQSKLVESSVTATNNNQTRTITLKNINVFAGTNNFLGGKTGELPQSGGNLISVFNISNDPKLIIVLGSSDRFGETQQIVTTLKGSYSKLTKPKKF